MNVDRNLDRPSEKPIFLLRHAGTWGVGRPGIPPRGPDSQNLQAVNVTDENVGTQKEVHETLRNRTLIETY